MADDSCCPHYQSHSKMLTFSLLVKFYWPQTQSQDTGHKILAPQKEVATIPSQCPTSGARASASGSAISSAHYPKTMRSHHLSQLSLLHRRGAFPRLCELLEVKGSKASPSTYGCSCAPLAQSRKEDAEAGTAGRSSASDKYNKSRPSNQ